MIFYVVGFVDVFGFEVVVLEFVEDCVVGFVYYVGEY